MRAIRWTAAIGLVAVAGGVFFWFWITGQPMYSPGDGAELELNPVSHNADGAWRVSTDVSLHHFASGAGRNMLYVHGGPGIPETTAAPGLDLSGYRVHYYDQRGTGQSSQPFQGAVSSGMWENLQALVGALGIAQQIADIERIRRILGDERLILVGHSYGALLASLYATEFPDRVEGLILIAPANLLEFPSPEGALFDTVRERLPESDREAYDAWLAEHLDLGSVFEKSTAELQAIDGAFLPFFEKAAGPVPGEVAVDMGVWHVRAQYFSMGKRHDWRPSLASYSGPALIVHGGNDLQSLDVSETYAASFGGQRTYEQLPGPVTFPTTPILQKSPRSLPVSWLRSTQTDARPGILGNRVHRSGDIPLACTPR